MMRYIKLLILISFLFAALGCRAEEAQESLYKDFKPFKMIFLPDIFLTFEEKDGSMLDKESLVILQDVVKNVNQRQDVDFAVFGGNLTGNSDGVFSDLQMFLDTVADLHPKYYSILGNREADVAEGVSKGVFAGEFDEFDYDEQMQTFWKAEITENVLLIGLDSSLKGTDKGYINIHQLFWLDTILKNNRDKFTIIAVHHSPYSSLEKPDLFLDLLNLYPQVKVVLSGHDLKTTVIKENDRVFITCPSIVSYPNEYKILEIYPDKVKIDSEHISFKQLIKKARKKLGKKYEKPDSYSRKGKYFFNVEKKGLLWF